MLGIHTLKTRRRVIFLLLTVQLALVAVLGARAAEPAQLLTLAGGVRLVLQADALGRLFSLLICAVWLAVAVFAFEYMNHEGHRERFFGFYLMTLGAMMGVCFAGNLVTLYLFYEMMTLLSVPLVLTSAPGRPWTRPTAIWASRWQGPGWACWACSSSRATVLPTCLPPGGCWTPCGRGRTGNCCCWCSLSWPSASAVRRECSPSTPGFPSPTR